jgi:hypothetical protein
MINLRLLPLWSLLLIFYSCSKMDNIVELKSEHLTIGIDAKGNVSKLTDNKTQKDYLSKDTIAPLISVKKNAEIIYAVAASVEENKLVFEFEEGIILKVKFEEKPTHIFLELVEVIGMEEIELIVWGPVPTTINTIIGETIGVVRGDEFALGILTLNTKTLGGFPWKENDTMPQFDIFDQDDFSDLNETGKGYTLYRVEAAKPEIFGSTLQAYCRNRLQERIIPNMGDENYISPAFDDGGVMGSKIALFGCPVEQTLETIGEIQKEEDLPHPVLDGKWVKTNRAAAAAYLIYDFGEKTIEEAIEYTKKAGLKYLYHPGPFKNWGHFELDENSFPNGWDGLKICVEKAEAEGIYVGLHTLSNFITTNDPYVSPVPDSRLGEVGYSELAGAVDENQVEIPIVSPVYFNQFSNNNLHTVMVGSELIRYRTVSESAPWKLLDCQRGAWGTKKASHETGAKISKLADHAYKVFLTNPELTIEMAERLADLYNHCGLRQISFDGIEGNNSTGMGNYGEILFATTWYNNLSDKIREHLIIDASRTSHYFWHTYTRMNWGEPWYAGFRESQTEYRMKNQAYFQRNMMPGMLGWFSMKNFTPVEDIEWMLARSAAYDAGYAFVTGKEQLEANGHAPEILELIKLWENARMKNVFSEDQKERMKDIKSEFHLVGTGENSWNLHPVYTFRFEHEDKVRQPGEPLYTTFKFENMVEKGSMNFIITAQNATISEISVEINNGVDVKIPVQLKKGESLRYYGGEFAGVYDANLKKKEEVKLAPAIFKMDKGAQSVIFDCAFSSKQEDAKAKIEIRIFDKPEILKGEQ